MAKERARLQAIAERSRVNVAREKREREEAPQVAAVAKAARKSAKTPTPPPQRKATPKEPSYSLREATPHPRDRTATPPKRAHIDPWVVPEDLRAEPFIPAGISAADFPDVEMSILPKEKARTRLSSNSAGTMAKPVENWRFCIIRHGDAAGFGWR